RACHSNNLAGTQLKENLHFRGDNNSLFSHLVKLIHIKTHTWRSEDNIRIKVFKIVFSRTEDCSAFSCKPCVFSQLFLCSSVTGGNNSTTVGKHLYKRQIACAYSAESNPLSLYIVKKFICLTVHNKTSV